VKCELFAVIIAHRFILAFARLVIAIVFGSALVHLSAMLMVYATLALQDEPIALNPGILAGALWVGAMQGVGVLPAAFPLGGAAHIGLIYARRSGLVVHAGAGLLIAGITSTIFGFVYGFTFTTTFVVMTIAAGLLGGALFWLGRRPDRD